MAKKAIGFDVWLVATQRVYRAVPFEVVTDWLQQGRINANDKFRPSGQGEWKSVADARAFAAFVPIQLPHTSENAAEVFEPIDVALPIRRRHDDEDDDVDMIPLIDISLVLLIFFMMTATVAVSGADIETPTTYHGIQLASGTEAVWLGADKGPSGAAVYSFGVGNAPADDADRNLSLAQVVKRLDAHLAAKRVGIPVRIAGNRGLPFGAVQALTAEVEKRRGPNQVIEIKAEVSERSS